MLQQCCNDIPLENRNKLIEAMLEIVLKNREKGVEVSLVYSEFTLEKKTNVYNSGLERRR